MQHQNPELCSKLTDESEETNAFEMVKESYRGGAGNILLFYSTGPSIFISAATMLPWTIGHIAFVFEGFLKTYESVTLVLRHFNIHSQLILALGPFYLYTRYSTLQVA